MVSVMLTAADIPGADLSELLVLFWHRYREKCLEQARDCDLSCLLSIQNTLNHLGLVPGSLGNRWKKALGSWLGLLPQHVSYRYVQHTALFSFVLQPILTLCTPSLPPGPLVKHHSHMNCVIRMVLVTRRFQTAPCQKRATGCNVTSIKFLRSCVQLAYCY